MRTIAFAARRVSSSVPRGLAASRGSCAWRTPVAASLGAATRPAPFFAGPQLEQRRTFLFGLFGKKKGSESLRPPPILEQDNLFHPLSQSPFPDLRSRGEKIRMLAPCPQTMARDGVKKPVRFECPNCGYPTHHTKEDWEQDKEHIKYCGRLRQVNEDEHDLRSGRELKEFRLAPAQEVEDQINFSNWDMLLYTRAFEALESERSKRHITRMLTFPYTIAAALHENKAFTRRNHRLTFEGLRSFIRAYSSPSFIRLLLLYPSPNPQLTEKLTSLSSFSHLTICSSKSHPILSDPALTQTLQPPRGSRTMLDPVRIIIVGARGESFLPPDVWMQLKYVFPTVPLHLIMIGPEVEVKIDPLRPASRSMTDEELDAERDSNQTHITGAALGRGKFPLRHKDYGVPGRSYSFCEGLTLTVLRGTYEQVHEQLEPFDPFHDVFFAFSPGFGFPSLVAVEELAKARKEEEEDQKRMKAARETYFAGATTQSEEGAAVGSQATPNTKHETQAEAKDEATDALPDTEKVPGAPARTVWTEEDVEAARTNPDQYSGTVLPGRRLEPSPAGGDTPSREPEPMIPQLTSSKYRAVTTAPVVQAQREWALALQQILSTKCALIATGFSPADVERDVLAFESVEGVKDEFEWLITPGENPFASTTWQVADFDPRVAVKANWGLWAVRGKAYDVTEFEENEEEYEDEYEEYYVDDVDEEDVKKFPQQAEQPQQQHARTQEQPEYVGVGQYTKTRR